MEQKTPQGVELFSGKETPEELVKLLYRKYISGDPLVLTQLGAAIESDIDQVFCGGVSFLVELIQNADDAEAREFNVDIRYEDLLFFPHSQTQGQFYSYQVQREGVPSGQCEANLSLCESWQ